MTSVSRFKTLKNYECFQMIFQKQLLNKSLGTNFKEKCRNGYKSKIFSENFKNQRDFVNAVGTILLENDFSQNFTEPKETMQELNSSINKQEEEITKLKTKYTSLRSSQEVNVLSKPFFEKLSLSDNFTKTSTMLITSTLAFNNSLSSKPVKYQKTGVLLSSLIKKLKNK